MMTKGPEARGQGPAKKDERGFALLLVFLMAAVIALYLYTQLPRVAFESERDKEQTLIDRGEQYKRAIQLYVVAVKKYPSKIEDLENTNEKRYLRRRYIDPMTGKDEWRLIHVNAAGILTDSLVQKPPTGPDGKPQQPGGGLSADSTATSTATNTAANGVPAPADPNDVNVAVRRRPSDVVGQAYTAPAGSDPNDPSTWGPIALTPATGTGTAPHGQPPAGAVGFNGGLPRQGGLPPPNQTGFQLPGQPGFNPMQNQFKIDANGQLVPVPINPQPVQTPQIANGQMQQNAPPLGGGMNAPGMTPPGNNPAVAPNSGLGMIQSMLTNPNPQPGTGLGTAAGMTTGGIAGVASNYKGTSIKVYGARQKYQEWEFVFSLNNGQNGVQQNRNPLGGNQPNGQNGTNPQGTGTAPGQTGTPPSGSTTGN